MLGEQLDCYSAVAVHCTPDLNVRAFISDYEGTRAIRASRRGSDPASVFYAVFDDIVAQGAEELLCVSSKTEKSG